MQDIHPHWQSTEPTVIGSSPGQSPRAAPRKTVSRRPAALVGIFLVTAVGVLYFGGRSLLSGQIAPVATDSSSSIPADAITITITPTGVDPLKVTVRPGQTIVWKNEGTLPHIFESKDLRDDGGQSLYSPAIFPQSSQSFTVSRTQPEGVYHYDSVTANDVGGEIDVVGVSLGAGATNSASNQPATTGVTDTAPPASPSTPPVSNDPLLQGFSLNGNQSSNPYETVLSQESLIPVNPNTYDRGGTTPRPTGSVTNTPTHQGAPSTPHPLSQPSSGAETWIVALILTTMLGVGMLLIPRKAK